MMNENYTIRRCRKAHAKASSKVCTCCTKQNAAQESRTCSLMGSGTILREALAAAEMLREDFGIYANVWSATSLPS